MMGIAGDSGILHVYVAASLRGFVAEQRAVIEALLVGGQLPAGAGLLAADVDLSPASSTAWLRRSDLLLVVLGAGDGGFIAASGESVVERELAAAREAGIPVMTVVLGEEMSALQGPRLSGARGERLRVLRQRLVDAGAAEAASLAELKLAVLQGVLGCFSAGVHRWIREDRVVVDVAVAAELARLSAEVRELRRRPGTEAEAPTGEREIAGLSVDQWLVVLEERRVPELRKGRERALHGLLLEHASAFALGVSLGERASPAETWRFSEVGGLLVALGLATLEGTGVSAQIVLNAAGRELVASISVYASVEPIEETVVATSDSGLRARIQSSGEQEADDEKTNFWSLDPPPQTGHQGRRPADPPGSGAGATGEGKGDPTVAE